jgi:hypothetical protein
MLEYILKESILTLRFTLQESSDILDSNIFSIFVNLYYSLFINLTYYQTAAASV